MAERISAQVAAVKPLGCASELVLEMPPTFAAEPGQFVHVHCGGTGLILRRPYSLYDVKDGTASLLVREVGAGSAWLREREVGERLDMLAPLGRGFELHEGRENALVAGGTGIACMRFLAARMRERSMKAVVFWGVENGGEYGGLPAFLQGETDLRLASMDGSLGHKGNVVDLFESAGASEFDAIYACGPRGMLSALAERIGDGKLGDLQVSMEERMACGVGACRGCAVPAARPQGGYVTACKDGPVFYGWELDWRRI